MLPRARGRERYDGAGHRTDGAQVANAVRFLARIWLAQAAARHSRSDPASLRHDPTPRDEITAAARSYRTAHCGIFHLRPRPFRPRPATGLGTGAHELRRTLPYRLHWAHTRTSGRAR